MSDLRITRLHKHYGAVHAVKGIDLEVPSGEFTVLVGPSGCGKSTLLRSIAGLEEVDGGTIEIGNRDVTWERPRDRDIAMVFQSYALYPYMNVFENIAFGLRARKVARADIDKRVRRAAEMLGIGALLDRRPRELSGGQRQRVAIGRAIVRDARLFLFDEPLSNLDAQLRDEMRAEIKRLHQELKRTMIYVTHDQIEALTLADRVAVMHGGVIQQLAAPNEIYRRPANRFVAGFVGSPSMNFRRGTVATGGDGPVFRSGELTVPLAGYEFAAAVGDGAEVELGIRPEHIVVSERGTRYPVDIVDPMGAETLVWCRVAGEPMAVRLDGEAIIKVGDTLPVGFPPDRLNLFDAASGERL
jgi:multiple sugar transport system ATP-binding protein